MEEKLIKGIKKAVEKLQLDLTGKVVFTEGATGNYVVTPLIAALAGAKEVYAFTKDSFYGSVEDVKTQIYNLAMKLNVDKKIKVITSFEEVPFEKIDILTNTGFLRPINRPLIEKLSSKCVIPLMYEPWEFRKDEIDLEACYEKGIKVYGTNENDKRLRTMEYIGFCVLYLLLDNKITPFDSKVLLIGCKKFIDPVLSILTQNDYDVDYILDYNMPKDNLLEYDVIVLLEHQRDRLIIGEKDSAYISKNEIREDTLVIHICGNVNFKDVKFRYVPKNIRPYGYMSIRADFVDPQAVIDLHTAGLKVAEGMLKANELGLKGKDYKTFLEENYPALAFEESKFW